MALRCRFFLPSSYLLLKLLKPRARLRHISGFATKIFQELRLSWLILRNPLWLSTPSLFTTVYELLQNGINRIQPFIPNLSILILIKTFSNRYFCFDKHSIKLNTQKFDAMPEIRYVNVPNSSTRNNESKQRYFLQMSFVGTFKKLNPCIYSYM